MWRGAGEYAGVLAVWQLCLHVHVHVLRVVQGAHEVRNLLLQRACPHLC
jgi:hypothetical protein